MNALLQAVSDALHHEIHLPLLHHTKHQVSRSLEPGGAIYTRYVQQIRNIVVSSDYREVHQNLKQQVKTLKIVSIESRPIRERCETGLITADGYALIVHAKLPEGDAITFGWFDDFSKKQ